MNMASKNSAKACFPKESVAFFFSFLNITRRERLFLVLMKERPLDSKSKYDYEYEIFSILAK